MKQTPFLLLGAGLLVQFCQNPKPPSEPEVVKTEPAVIRYACRGSSPVLWLVDIYTDSIVYERGGGKKQIYPYPKWQVKGDTTIFQSTLGSVPNESIMTVKIIADSCSDGHSSQKYPFTVFVERDGDLLNGCALDSGPQ